MKLEDFPGSIVQEVGKPVDPEAISQSLKNLYATGLFTELQADAESLDGGVELVFAGKAQYFAGMVRVEGTPGSLDSRILVTATRLRLGQPLTEEDLTSASQRVRESLAENGYYEARILHEVQRDPDTQEADVVLHITPGAPSRLKEVKFLGTTVFTPEQLAAISHWRPGVQLTAARAERGLLRIRQFYLAQGRLQSTVRIANRAYDPKDHTESLQVQVNAGPFIQVRVKGAQVSGAKLRELLPLYRDGAVDDPGLARCDRILEDHFQQMGYFSAAVTSKRDTSADSQTVHLTFEVTLGQVEEFAGYGFDGNHTVPTTTLTSAIATQSSGLLRPQPVFSHELLDRNLNTLIATYRSRGFLEARLTPQFNHKYQGQPGRMFVTFEVDEGPRTTVGDLTLHGVEPEMQKDIWRNLLTKTGQAYSPERAQTDRDFIMDYLGDRGHAHATVTWRASAPNSNHQVDLEYQIEPGPQESIERIAILGIRRTRAGIVQREVGFQAGQPLNQREILDSQRRLYSLGIFNQVQIATQENQVPGGKKTVLVGTEEGRRWTLGYGGGFEVQKLGSNNPEGQYKASPRLSLDVTRLNVGGSAQTFTLRGRLSNLESGGAISYLIPRLFGQKDLGLRLNGLVDRSRDVLTFSADRREASVNIEKRFSPAAILIARYSFRRVQALDISSRISPEEIPILSRKARVGMLGISYVNDHRDDPTDATRGSYSLADAGISWDKFGSEANFMRFGGQNASYYRLGSRLVFARNTRLGIESPYGALRPVSITNNGQTEVVYTNEIPLPERFFMGGSESHRGFSINQAGPRDPSTGYPIGGNALFFNSFELRLPLTERRLGFALFHDAGNVFSTVRKMRLLKVTQSSPADLDYASHAVGMGVRYKTPVGPVRFDVGYNLNPPRYNLENNGVPEVQRLSQFQFFLSLGQTF